MGDEGGHTVKLRVYDLSLGMAKTMSLQLVGEQFDLIPHTGVEVYGVEFFFGGGVQQLSPATVEATFGMKPVEVLELGTTEMPRTVFDEFLQEISPRFSSSTYNLFTHNCNNFTDEVVQFLLGEGIPKRILDLPQRFLATPLGSSLRPVFDQQAQTMNARLAGAGGQLQAPGAAAPSASGGIGAVTDQQAVAAAVAALMQQQQQQPQPQPQQQQKTKENEEAAAPEPAPDINTAAADPDTADGPTMNVSVRSTQGKTVTYTVSEAATVQQLKEIVEKGGQFDLKAGSMRLVYQGKILENMAASLTSAGISSGTTLIIVPGASKGPAKRLPLREALLALVRETPAAASKTAITTVLKLCENILSKPTEAKFRRVRKGNKAFQSRILAVPQAVCLLQSAGFSDAGSDEFYMFDPTSEPELPDVVTQLRAASSSSAQSAQPAAGGVPAPTTLSPPNLGGMGGMGGLPDAATMQAMMQTPQARAMMQAQGVTPDMAQMAMNMLGQNPGVLQQALNNPHAQQMMAAMGGGMGMAMPSGGSPFGANATPQASAPAARCACGNFASGAVDGLCNSCRRSRQR